MEDFLTYLARDKQVAPSTQNQAMNALVFFYKQVLKQPFTETINAERAPGKVKMPVVLTREETSRLLNTMSGPHQLAVKLLYGCGLRISECLRLRIQDLDFGQGRIFVRGGKGGKDRTVVLPEAIRSSLADHVERVNILHTDDLREGFGEVYIPEALARKYPNACREIGWQYAFPSKGRSKDPRSGKTMRHHVMESGLQKAVKEAVRKAGITKRAGCHTMRHSYATHLLENGVNIRMVQEAARP